MVTHVKNLLARFVLCMDGFVHVCKYIQISICVCIYIRYIRVYIYIYIRVYIYIYIYVCVVYIYIYIYTYVYIHIDMSVCVCSSRCLHKSRIWISTEETLCANVSTQVIARSTHCACRTITCKQDMMSYPPYRKVCLSVMSHLWSYV